MQRKRSPIFQKVFNMKKVSILIAKLRKPLTRKLIILKKGRKLEFAGHYNYGCIQEYEYSPSSTRMIMKNMMRPTLKNRKLLNKLHHSFLYFLNCVCILGDEKSIQSELMKSGYSISMEDSKMEELTKIGGEEDDDDWSVDERADKFIQSFYEEIRRQRNEALLQLTE